MVSQTLIRQISELDREDLRELSALISSELDATQESEPMSMAEWVASVRAKEIVDPGVSAAEVLAEERRNRSTCSLKLIDASN
jgi:hypothetical protein